MRRNAGNTAFEAYTPDTGGGITIGDAVTGGGANRVLYEDGSQNLAADSNLTFNGSVLTVSGVVSVLQQSSVGLSIKAADPVPDYPFVVYDNADAPQLFVDTNWEFVSRNAARLDTGIASTVGVPTQAAPLLYLTGTGWDGAASSPVGIRIRMNPEDYATPTFSFQCYPNSGSGWAEFFGVSTVESGLTARWKIGNPRGSGWGGYLDATYDGIFAFRTAGATLSGLRPGYITWTGASAPGYQSIRAYDTYGTAIQSAFGAKIALLAPETGFGAAGPFQVEMSSAFGGLYTPSAIVETRGTSEQLRVAYDADNYAKATVASNGAVTFDAVGSGAAFAFSDNVAINGSLTLSAQNIVTDTSTGMKIGTGTTQKLGFFNATPVVQRTDSGALTDSTGGSVTGTINEVSATYDEAEHNANYASLTAKINALRTALRDLGLMA